MTESEYSIIPELQSDSDAKLIFTDTILKNPYIPTRIKKGILKYQTQQEIIHKLNTYIDYKTLVTRNTYDNLLAPRKDSIWGI